MLVCAATTKPPQVTATESSEVCRVIGFRPYVCISIRSDLQREGVLLHADPEALESRQAVRLQVGTLTHSLAAKV